MNALEPHGAGVPRRRRLLEAAAVFFPHFLVQAIVEVEMREVQEPLGVDRRPGAEYAFGNGWSVKADYLYVRLENKEYFNPPPVGFAIRGNVPVDQHIGRIGVNYKFTNCLLLFGCGAVVAKY